VAVVGFDFGPERTYDAQTVAQKVVWPYVDSVARAAFGIQDWREDSQGNDKLTIERDGMHAGNTVHVEIAARCYEEDDPEDPEEPGEEPIRFVEINVGIKADEESRDVLLGIARLAFEDFADLSPEEEAPEWPEGDDDELMVINGRAHSFYDTGEWDCSAFRRVEGARSSVDVPLCEGEELLYVFDNDAEQDDDTKIPMRLSDIEDLELALAVLDAPRAIRSALAAIKSNPL